MASDSLFPVALAQFSVKLEGPNLEFKLGLFAGCEGLSAEYAFDEVMEGGNNAFVHKLPGRVKYQNVKLTRLINADSMNIAAWFSAYQSRGLGRSTAIITMYDSHHESGSNILCKWTLRDVHPLKWTGPSFAADGSGVAKETLELAHHGFEWTT